MNDLRPKIGVEGTLLRKYYSKKAGALRVSKNSILQVQSPDSYNCRETLGHRIKDLIKPAMHNPVTDTDSYKFEPLIATKLKTKTIYGRSNIKLTTSSVKVSSFFYGNRNAQRDVLKVMHYILGIIGVCLSDTTKERTRRAHMGTPNEYSSIDIHNPSNCVEFNYGVLSPFWFVSPVMQSIITGIARNCLSVVYDKSVNYKKYLLDKVSIDEINRIIREADRKSALKVYKNIILPFFNKYGGGGDIFLYNNPYKRIITKLVEEGCFKVFVPSKTVKYWVDFDDHYGLESFSEDVGRNINWDRFRCL